MTEQQYLLQCLSEELSEVQQEISKCQRFTPDHIDPVSGMQNITKVRLEYADVHALLRMLEKTGLFIESEHPFVRQRINEKISRTVRLMKVSRELGVLEDEPLSFS